MAIFLLCLPLFAQGQKHDSEKFNQIRSMENGTWSFSPKSYYYWFHKSYSGGTSSFLGLANIKFKESKSNVKRVFTSRTAQLAPEALTADHVQKQIDSIQPLVTEETIRYAERNMDVMYPLYKDDFAELGQAISESLVYALEKSKGKLEKACTELQMEYDVICNEIEYIHRSGPGNEIESTKRQLAYEDAKERLTSLANSCYKLAVYASTL